MMQGSCVGEMSPVIRSLIEVSSAATKGARRRNGADEPTPCRHLLSLLQFETHAQRIRLIKAARIAWVVRLRAEIILVVAVQQVGRIEGKGDSLGHSITC